MLIFQVSWKLHWIIYIGIETPVRVANTQHSTWMLCSCLNFLLRNWATPQSISKIIHCKFKIAGWAQLYPTTFPRTLLAYVGPQWELGSLHHPSAFYFNPRPHCNQPCRPATCGADRTWIPSLSRPFTQAPSCNAQTALSHEGSQVFLYFNSEAFLGFVFTLQPLSGRSVSSNPVSKRELFRHNFCQYGLTKYFLSFCTK